MSKARDIADGAANINLLDDVTAGTVAASKVIAADSNKDVASFRNVTLTGELDAATLDVSGNADIDGVLETDGLSINGTSVTATAAELNILDGVTSTAAELNILDGVTATAAELNILDGVTSTTAELNYSDGVTSNIQTQLNAKQALDANLTSFVSAFTLPTSDGSNGQVLTTNGSGTLSLADAAGGGGWSLLSTVSGTNALTFVLSNVLSDTYYDYIVEGNLDTNSTYPNPMGFEFIKSGGSYQTSGYYQIHWGSEWTGTSLSTSYTRTSYYNLSGQYLTNGPMYLRIQIARPQTSSGGNAYIYVQSQVNALYSTTALPILSNGGVNSSQDYTGLRIKDFRSGPATLTGAIRVWGRNTS